MPETTKAPARTSPLVVPRTEPERRYNPDDDHCDTQVQRTIRRVAPLIAP